MELKKYYKLARPDGFDFWTGETINYRDGIGTTVKPPKADKEGSLCSGAFIHASDAPNKCFVGASIPCSAYLVEGNAVICDEKKCGFTKLRVLEEISDLDTLFGWNYTEACNPVHPFSLPQAEVTDGMKAMLGSWASVWDSVGASVWDSVRDSVWASVWDSVRDSVWDSVWASVRDSVWASVWASVGASVRASVGASVRAYIGSMFPHIKKWKYCEHEEGVYPYQPAVDLWKLGIVPSYDGKVWRLHSGSGAQIIYWNR